MITRDLKGPVSARPVAARASETREQRCSLATYREIPTSLYCFLHRDVLDYHVVILDVYLDTIVLNGSYHMLVYEDKER